MKIYFINEFDVLIQGKKCVSIIRCHFSKFCYYRKIDPSNRPTLPSDGRTDRRTSFKAASRTLLPNQPLRTIANGRRRAVSSQSQYEVVEAAAENP